MIYLDNNATTPVAPEVFDAMRPFLVEHFGNPSSSHRLGKTARQAVENARRQVGALIGASEENEIVFTSCGTESNNWAILAALESQPDKKHIVTSAVEHESVSKLCQKLEKRGYQISTLAVNKNGLLDLNELESVLNERTAVVSLMLANNETGVLFPVEKAAKIVKEKSSALFHVDGVQAVGKIPIDLKNTEIDLFSLSGHKLHAPKGVGALYIKNGVSLPKFLIGGGQERGRRAGTEAVAQTVGLGTACELAKNFDRYDEIKALRDRLENEILEKFPFARLNGDRRARLPNTSNISFAGIEGESILAHLDAREIYVSTGSACNAELHTASAVLQAMNVAYREAMGSIRFSLSRYTTAAEIDFTLQVLTEIIGKLRAISPLV